MFYQVPQTTGDEDPVKARFKTPNGKEIVVKPDGQYGMFIISFSSGGQLPKEFDGMFTTVEQAEKIIKRYIELKAAEQSEPKKEVINDKSKGKQVI